MPKTHDVHGRGAALAMVIPDGLAISEWRGRLCRSRLRPTWDRAGLERLVTSAAEKLAEVTRCDAGPGSARLALPDILATHGPWVAFSRRRHTERRHEMVAAAARTAGWLHALADSVPAPPAYGGHGRILFSGPYRLVLTLLQRAGRSINVYALPQRWGSPGRLERVLRRLIRRADAVLRPWGYRASWHGIAEAVSRGDRRLGRMALHAAASTLSQVAERDLGLYVRGTPRDVLLRLRGLHRAIRAANGGLYLGRHLWETSSLALAVCRADGERRLRAEAEELVTALRPSLPAINSRLLMAALAAVPGLVRAAARDAVALAILQDWLEEHP